MNKKRMLRNILIIALLLFFMMINNTIFAAGTFSLSKSSATITEGKTATFKINGSSATGRVDIKSSDASIATVSSSSEWLENSSKTITITAKKVGNATITVTGTVADEDGVEATVTRTIKVKVNAKTTSTTNSNNSSSTTTTKTKSNNAYLSTLGVTPKEYDFSGFSKTKTSYSVTVPSDVDSLKVLYKTADPGATVKVSGNSGFETGSDNTIKIVVTAEDGKTTKTYKIKVTKLATTEEQPGNVIEDEEGLYLTSLELDGVEVSPEFSKEVYSYTANLDDADATEIKVEAKANKEKANIEVSGNTDLVDGENTINILVTLEGSEEQTVYQVILTKAAKAVTVTDTETTSSEGNGTLNDLMGNLKKYIIIAVAVVVLIIVAVIVLIILLRRENKKLRDEELPEEDKNEEYNVYKNDVNEFENRSSEAENFIESLYRQRNGNLYNEEELDAEEKQTLEEINRATDEIFRDKVEGQSVEYISEEIEEEKRPRRRERGKHSK